ncbi:unnamed protein product [Symbiodinium sp. CCMP2592]|nr:unnamed protein product [Symbiodinium sp. CCMP2592]
MLLPLLLLATWPGGTEGAALRTIFRNEVQSSEPAQGEVVAHLYSVVDDYLRYYSEETATYKESKKAMTAIIRDALTEESRLGSINEKARLKKQHDKTVAEYVAVMKQLDEALQAMEGKDWAEKHGVKDQLDAMYKETPLALLSKASKPGHPMGLKQGLNLAADAAAHLRKLRSTLP